MSPKTRKSSSRCTYVPPLTKSMISNPVILEEHLCSLLPRSSCCTAPPILRPPKDEPSVLALLRMLTADSVKAYADGMRHVFVRYVHMYQIIPVQRLCTVPSLASPRMGRIVSARGCCNLHAPRRAVVLINVIFLPFLPFFPPPTAAPDPPAPVPGLIWTSLLDPARLTPLILAASPSSRRSLSQPCNHPSSRCRNSLSVGNKAKPSESEPAAAAETAVVPHTVRCAVGDVEGEAREANPEVVRFGQGGEPAQAPSFPSPVVSWAE